MSYNHDWKKDMETLCKHTELNWWKTGKRTSASAVSGSLSLKSSESTKDKKERKL